MMKITEKMSSWLIVIFDNIVLLANDPGEAVAKTKILLETFEYHNVILKMKKSWFGTPSVKFFG